jgi:hypothetical protein
LRFGKAKVTFKKDGNKKLRSEINAKAKISGGRQQTVQQGIYLHELRCQDEGGPEQGQGQKDKMQEMQDEATESDTQGTQGLRPGLYVLIDRNHEANKLRHVFYRSSRRWISGP